MKASGTAAFANQLFICLLVTFGFGGSVGLGTVWVRHQNALLANHNRALLASLADLDRRLAETATLVEGEQGADVLRRRNAEFRLGLVPAHEVQVTRVAEDPVQRLALRHNRELLNDGALPPITVRLALKD